MSNEVFNFQVESPYEEDIRFQTIISESEGGKEQRYQKWLKPRRTFRIQLRARPNNPYATSPGEADDLWRFYIRHKGAYDSFLFQNPTENPVTAETVGSGDGSKSVFYVGNKVSIGTGDVVLVPNSLAMKRSVRGTGDYLTFSAFTTEESLGQITTTVPLPSGDVLRADYTFYYRVRFREDQLTRETFVTKLCNFGVELEEVV